MSTDQTEPSGNAAARNCVLELWLTMKPSEISALGNVNNVKISDLRNGVVSSVWPNRKLACGGGVHFVLDYGNSYWVGWRFFNNNFKKSVALLFHLPLYKTILGQQLSYKVTLARKCKQYDSK